MIGATQPDHAAAFPVEVEGMAIMVESSVRTDGGPSRFVQLLETQLRQWAHALEQESGPILAISRKGPRLLELLVTEGLLDHSVLDRLVTERALPFLGQLAAPIVVTDDSITHGSTFATVWEHTRKVMLRSGIDASPVGLPFAMCDTAAPEFKRLARESFHSLSASEVAPFVENQIHALFRLGKPLDIDHPMVTLRGSFGGDIDLELALNALAASLHGTLIRVSPVQPVSGREEMQRTWTILLGPDDGLLAAPFRKVRIYRDVSGQLLTICPMRPLSWDHQILFGAEQLFHSAVAPIWERLRDAAPSSHNREEWAEISLVVCANFLATLELLSRCLPAIRASFAEIEVHSIEPPRTNDLQLLVGPEIARFACQQIARVLDDSTDTGPWVQRGVHDLEQDAPVVPQEYQESYQQALHGQLDRSTSTDDAVHAIFYAQHTAIELPSRLKAESEGRLNFGVPYSYIERIIHERHGDVGADLVHRSVDRLIDRGCIVPLYHKQRIGDKDVWGRIFRVGEGSVPNWTHAIRMLFQCLSQELGTNAVLSTCFEKFVVLAACPEINLQDTRLPPLRQALDSRRAFHLYGARSTVEVDQKREFLLDWAVDHKILRHTPGPVRGATHAQEYHLCDIDPLYPPQECPFDGQVREGLEDLATCVALIRKTPGLGDNALILVSTLASAHDYWQALAAELGLWLFDGSASFYQAMRQLGELGRGFEAGGRPSARALETANETVLANANITAQVAKKTQLFSLRREHHARIAAAMEGNRVAGRAWRKIERHLVEEERLHPDVSVSGLTEILSALRIAHTSTGILRCLLGLAGHAHSDRDVAKKLSELIAIIESDAHVDRVSRALFEDIGDGSSPLEELRNAKVLLRGSFRADFETLREPLLVVADRCERIYREYGPLRPAPRWITLDPPQFIILWDTRGSTDVAQPDENLAPFIERANKRILALGKKVRGFKPDYDDGNGVVCGSFRDVLAVFTVLNEVFIGPVVRVGCEANIQGRLRYDPESGLLEGRAWAHAARTMGFFKEVRNTGVWTGSTLPDEPRGNYLVIGEFARRFAEKEGQWPSSAEFEIVEPAGQYLPRVLASLPISVSLLLPRL